MIVELKRFFEQLDQRMANVFGIRAAGRLLQNHGKLVSPGSSHSIGTANPCGADLGNVLEHEVANVMAQRIVDLLEVVEINQEQGGLRSRAAGALHGVGEPVLKEPAIGQAGQLVMQGEMLVVLDLVLKEQQTTNTEAQAKNPAMVTNAPAVARRYI